MTFPAANAIYRRETYDNYPAARAILQVVYEGLQLPFDLALRVESRWFAKILRSPRSGGDDALAVRVDAGAQQGRAPARPAAQHASKRVGIIGAGFMGASVGYVTALAGIDVVLIDRDQETADRGKAHSAKLIGDQINRGRATAAERDALLARITATADYAALADCDLVIEAVFEDRKVKAETYAKAQAALAPGVIFGSNTSTLPITSLANGVRRSFALHRHPFLLAGRADDAGRDHPRQGDRRRGARDRARLCARDPQDADRGQRFARLLHLARGRHLYPRRPSDARRGRAGGDDRECRPHGRHAGRPARAQRRGRGRSRLEDRQGDRGRSRRRRDRSRAEGSCSPSWSRSAAATAARTARASTTIPTRARSGCGRGSPSCRRRSSIPTPSTSQELKDRLLAIQALETARCFEEGVLTDVREADVGSILGFGFAPFSGGTLSYIDMMGTERFVALCEELADETRAALRAVAAAPRHGGEGRDLLRPLRAARARQGGVRGPKRMRPLASPSLKGGGRGRGSRAATNGAS